MIKKINTITNINSKDNKKYKIYIYKKNMSIL